MHLKRFKAHLSLLPVLLTLMILMQISGAMTGCIQESSTTASSAAPASSATTTVSPATSPPTTSDLPTETSLAPTPTPAPAILNPLTGTPLANQNAVGQRPVAIMINNHKQALPQIGIGEADLIYEMQVEGGITRLMAVFADVSAIPEIGSVRSARHDYIDLAGGLDAIYVHIGASNLANAQFSKQKTAHIDLHVYPQAYWRDQEWRKQRGYEHSVKTTGSRLQQAIATSKYRTTIREGQGTAFSFRSEDDFAPAAGDAATTVAVPYSTYVTATFAYHQETGLYSKGQFNAEHLDMATGQPLQFRNIFLIMTKVTIVDSNGHKDARLEKGNGYYISGGQWQAINWQKGATNDPFVFTDKSGNTLQVNCGKSYIGIVSDQRKISFKS